MPKVIKNEISQTKSWGSRDSTPFWICEILLCITFTSYEKCHKFSCSGTHTDGKSWDVLQVLWEYIKLNFAILNKVPGVWGFENPATIFRLAKFFFEALSRAVRSSTTFPALGLIPIHIVLDRKKLTLYMHFESTWKWNFANQKKSVRNLETRM